MWRSFASLTASDDGADTAARSPDEVALPARRIQSRAPVGIQMHLDDVLPLRVARAGAVTHRSDIPRALDDSLDEQKPCRQREIVAGRAHRHRQILAVD